MLQEVTSFAQEHQTDVVKRCIAAEPHHGAVWQSVAKDMAHTGKSTNDTLMLVSEALH